MTQHKFGIFDTETTGLYTPSMPSNHPDQPHILSIGAILADDTGAETDRFFSIIKPDGWDIPEDSIKIHGITMERAMAEGRPGEEVMHEFLTFMGRARIRTGFNEPFDRRMVRIELYRLGRAIDEAYGHGVVEFCKPGEAPAIESIREELADWWNYGPPDYDVMKLAKDLMGVKKGFKLKDAYFYFLEREMPNAHSAIDDAHHTREILEYLIGRGDVVLDDEWFAGKAEFKAKKLADKIAARANYR